jgi:hypothetical protein
MFQLNLAIFRRLSTFSNHRTAVDRESIHVNAIALSLFTLKHICLEQNSFFVLALFSTCSIQCCKWSFVLKQTYFSANNHNAVALTYEAYLQNKFRLQILLLQHCSHCGAHACRVCWSFWKAQTPFADNRTAFMHRPVCL